MADAVLITRSLDRPGFFPFADLVAPLHEAACKRWGIHYWVNREDFAGYDPMRGSWEKILLVRDALGQGYEYVFWIDPDAYWYDAGVDLRDALAGGVQIGAVQHGPIPNTNVPRHLNVGALYFRNTPLVRTFVQEWLDGYDVYSKRPWLEQGYFNELAQSPKYAGLVQRIDDRWNSTFLVNDAPNPVVKAFHSGLSARDKYNQMRASILKRGAIGD